MRTSDSRNARREGERPGSGAKPEPGVPDELARHEFVLAVRAHEAALYQRALGFSRDPAAARDLVQDALLKAFRSLGQFAPGTNMRCWLTRILVNHFLDSCRRRALSPTFEPLDPEAALPDRNHPFDEGEPAPLSATISMEQLQAALAELEPMFREPYQMRIQQKLSYRQIGEALGIPAATVGTRLARAREKLRELLAPAEDGELGGGASRAAEVDGGEP